MDEKI